MWSKFNAFLVANSIVLGSIALFLTAQSRLALFIIGMPIFGILLCVLWFLTTRRSFDYYRYWIFSARELEEQYMSDSVETISRGGTFAEGKKIEIMIGSESKHMQMSRLSRLLRVEWTSYLIITLFVLMYLMTHTFQNIAKCVRRVPNH